MKTTKITYGSVKPIEKVIFTIRGEKVILDADLAATYGVATKELNRAIKRNSDRLSMTASGKSTSICVHLRISSLFLEFIHP
ncbi:MAG: ORF6N domain-containing protein [Verrucomicrobia bacterium]|nr:ORF6N domain-containing protein [Verrucomicrobiota bacterium]